MRGLLELYGYDVALDYKADGFHAALKDACPGGVDAYFDNVGGEVSAARAPAAERRRADRDLRPDLSVQRRTAGADLPPGHADRVPRPHAGLSHLRLRRTASTRRPRGSRRWVAEGKLRWREHVTEGLENAPAAFLGMLRGENRGKALVKVAERAL